MTMIDISGLDKGAVLAALWNNAALPPASVDPNPDTHPMTAESANSVFLYRRVTNGQTGDDVYGFDYFGGRLLKVNISGDTFDPWGYDRDRCTPPRPSTTAPPPTSRPAGPPLSTPPSRLTPNGSADGAPHRPRSRTRSGSTRHPNHSSPTTSYKAPTQPDVSSGLTGSGPPLDLFRTCFHGSPEEQEKAGYGRVVRLAVRRIGLGVAAS